MVLFSYYLFINGFLENMITNLSKALLTILQFTEVLIEICARAMVSEKEKWRIIFLVESIK